MKTLRMQNPKVVIPAGTDTVEVSGECFFTGRKYVAWYPRAGFYAWYLDDVKIQIAMPEVSAGDREWLISGTHPDVFDELFPDE